MRIVHEGLNEAYYVSSVLREVFGFQNSIEEANLRDAFEPIPEFGGFYDSSKLLARKLGPEPTLVLTPRDIYANDENQDDDWVFGYSEGKLCVVSTARLKGSDSKPRNSVEIPIPDYLKRLGVMSIHEVGHDVIRGKHFEQAVWFNEKTGYKLKLGPHCTDNACAMYEVVDVKSPEKSEGYMILGNERKYDAYLDDLVKRLHPRWLCEMCKSSISFDKKVYN
jgi:hypothetical protein